MELYFYDLVRTRTLRHTSFLLTKKKFLFDLHHFLFTVVYIFFFTQLFTIQDKHFDYICVPIRQFDLYMYI